MSIWWISENVFHLEKIFQPCYKGDECQNFISIRSHTHEYVNKFRQRIWYTHWISMVIIRMEKQNLKRNVCFRNYFSATQKKGLSTSKSLWNFTVNKHLLVPPSHNFKITWASAHILFTHLKEEAQKFNTDESFLKSIHQISTFSINFSAPSVKKFSQFLHYLFLMLSIVNDNKSANWKVFSLK